MEEMSYYYASPEKQIPVAFREKVRDTKSYHTSTIPKGKRSKPQNKELVLISLH